MIKLNSLKITDTALSQSENVIISPNGNPLFCWVEDGVLKTLETDGSIWPPVNTTEHSPSGEVKMSICGKNYLLFFLDSSSNLQCVEYNGTVFSFYPSVEVVTGVALFDVTRDSDEVKVAYVYGDKLYVAGRNNDSRVWEIGTEVVISPTPTSINAISIDYKEGTLAVAYITESRVSVYQDPEVSKFQNVFYSGTASDIKIRMIDADNFDLIYNLDGSILSSSSSSSSSNSCSSSSSSSNSCSSSSCSSCSFSSSSSRSE